MTELAHAIARSTTVDAAGRGALTANQVKVAGPEHYRTDRYLIFYSRPSGPIPEAQARRFVGSGVEAFFSFPQPYRVVLREKATSPSGDVTAATLTHEYYGTSAPRVYPDVALAGIDTWWSSLVVVDIQDQRLKPFFDRLGEFEQGNWDSLRGKRPSRKALDNARAVLNELKGGTLVPTRLIGSDGRIVLYFTSGERYSNIELAGSGALLMINSSGQGFPEVKSFTLRKLSSVLDKIRAHIS